MERSDREDYNSREYSGSSRKLPALLLLIVVAGAVVGVVLVSPAAPDVPTPELFGRTPANGTVNVLVTYDGVTHVPDAARNDTAAYGYHANVTAYNESGVPLTPGIDYRWNATDGGIAFNDTNATAPRERVRLEYQYYTSPPPKPPRELAADAATSRYTVAGIAALFGVVVLYRLYRSVTSDSSGGR